MNATTLATKPTGKIHLYSLFVCDGITKIETVQKLFLARNYKL